MRRGAVWRPRHGLVCAILAYLLDIAPFGLVTSSEIVDDVVFRLGFWLRSNQKAFLSLEFAFYHWITRGLC